jgi:hypothetical protein
MLANVANAIAMSLELQTKLATRKKYLQEIKYTIFVKLIIRFSQSIKFSFLFRL